MKKTFFTLVMALGLSAGTASAQKLFVRAGLGYALPSGSQRISDGSNSKDPNTEFNTNGSYGTGFNGELGIGYMFNKNIGLGLDISYLVGKKNLVKDDRGNDRSQLESSGSAFAFTPNIVLSTAMEGKMVPYAKAGLVIASASVTDVITGTAGSIYVLERKTTGGIALGFKGAMGINFAVNQKISLYGEIAYTAMSYRPTKAVITKFTSNGIDVLAGSSVKDRETTYSVEVDNTASSPSSSPRKEITPVLPFGSIGLNFGVMINL